MKIPFDIKYSTQIESGEYKVETRDGRPVRIICWDRLSEDGDSIVALINDGTNELNYFYKNTGRFLTSSEDTLDLFIITPEPELTEFEKEVASWLETAKDEPITNEMIVDAADNLMFCARQQIIRGAELSEEDERIRKSIIRLLQVGGYMPLEDKEKAFAYLEKQKEKNTLSTEETELNSIAFLEQLGYTCVPPGAEQKPAECIEFDNEFKNQVSHLLASVLNKEWEYNKGFVEYAAQQLLGYANHEFKPAEWSEEDERMVSWIRTALSTSAYITPRDTKIVKEWLENRLKLFCSQPHWKPSKEQIEALEHFIRSWGESGTMSPQNPILCAAKSLYYDLQKL